MSPTFGPRKASPWVIDQLGAKASRPLQEGVRPASAWARQQAASGSMQVGGPDSRMATFPNEFAEKDEDLPNVFERGARGIGMGIASMIPASMTLAGGILEFAGLDDAGAEVADAGLSLNDWLQDNVAVENPKFYDHLMMGVGSMASFLLPGLGAAGAAGKAAQGMGLVQKIGGGAWKLGKHGGPVLSKAGRTFQTITGAGAMGFLEAGIEQSQRQQELMAEGQTPAEALSNSEGVFWQNFALLTATNAPFFSPAGRVARAALSTFSEGGQERFQGVIQDVASGRGEWMDFFDPSKYRTETAVGAIVGGVAGGLLPGDAKTKDEDTPKSRAADVEAQASVRGLEDAAGVPNLADLGVDIGDGTPREIGGPVEGETPLPRPAEDTSQPAVDEALKDSPQVPSDEVVVSEEQQAAAPEAAPVTEDAPAPVVESEPTLATDPIATVEKAAKEKAKSKKAPKGFDVLPLAAIETDPETFQVREGEGEFDEGFVAGAVENFDEQAVKPIEVWKDPKDGKFKIIDGHHTREILSRAGKKDATVKVFSGTREEAIEASQKRNDERRGNDILAQATVVRGQRDSGQTKAAVNKEAKRLYGKNWTTVVALSHLNPKGAVMDALRSFSSASDEGSQEIVRIAKWIGKALANNPKLTNAHEQEMFDDLKANMGKPNRKTQAEFTHFIDQLTDAFFDYGAPLNLKKLSQQGNVQREFNEQLDEAEKELKKARSDLEAARAKFVKSEVPQEAMDALLKKYNDNVTIAQREVLALKEREGDVTRNGGGEQALFMGKAKGMSLKSGQKAPVFKNLSNKAALSALEEATGASVGVVTKPTSASHKMMEKIAKRFGVEIVWFNPSQESIKAKTGGFYLKNDKGRVFMSTGQVGTPPLFILGHEIGHYMEVHHPEKWNKIIEAIHVAEGNPKTGEDVNDFMFKAVASGGYTIREAARELPSDAIGKAFLSDKFWNALREQDSSLWADLLNRLRDVLKSMRAVVAGSPRDMSRYVKDFAPIENIVTRQMKMVSAEERANMGLNSDPDQIDMFGYVKGRDEGQGTLFFKEIRVDEAAGEISRRQTEAKAVGEARSGVRSWRDWPRHFYQKMVDNNTWVYTLMRNSMKSRGKDIADLEASKRPDLILQAMGAWTEKAEMALKSVVKSWDNKTHLSDGLEVIIRKFGLAPFIDNGEFGQYVIARGMKARKEGLAKKGIDYFGPDPSSPEYQAAEAEYEKIQAIGREYDALEPDWAAAVEDITKWSNAMMTRLLQSGAISQTQHDALTQTYEVYAPLFVLDAKDAALPSGLQKTDATYAGRVTYESELLVAGTVRMDPMQGYVKNAYRLEFLAASNHAKMSAADFIAEQSGGSNRLEGVGERVPAPESNPVKKKVSELMAAAGVKRKDAEALDAEGKVDLDAMAKLWVAGNYLEDGTVAIMRDGEVEYWKLEPDIYDAYANIGNVSSHKLMKFFTAQTRMLRAGAVLTPEFMARNQMRDFLAAGVLSRHLVKNPKDAILLPLRIMRGLSHAIKKDEVYQDFIMDRAGHSSLVALDQENLMKHIDELNRSAGGVSFKIDKFKQNPVKYIVSSHPLALLQAFSKLTENSTRLAVYEKARADLQGQGATEAEARAQAAIDSREASTDFGRAGEYGRIINMMIPFFNATVQGNDKMVRALTRDKGHRAATWSRGALMVTLPSVLLWTINHDEEWYKEQPLWLKNHFWLFSIDGGKTIHKLPKPFEIGLLFGSLPERFLDWMFNKDPEAMKSWAESIKKTFMVDATDVMGPTISALNDTRTNYDGFRDTPIVKGWLQRLEPRAQYTASTSEFAKWLGDNYPGRGLSPLMVDHFVKSAFGGIGQWGMEIASNVVMMSDPKIKDMKPSSRLFYDTVPDWIPVIKAVTISTPSKYTRQMDEFYEQYDISQEAVNTLRAYRSGGASKEQIAKLYERTGVDIGMHESLVRAADAIGRVSKRIRAVESAPEDMFDRGEKREKIDELMNQRNQMIDKYMSRLNQVDRDKMQARVDKTVDKLRREIEQANRR